LSSPPNPAFYLDSSTVQPPAPEVPGGPPPIENPPWSGWDVLGIAIVTLVAIVLFLLATTVVAQHLLFPRLPVTEVAKFPLVTVAAQLLAYGVVLVCMFVVAKPAAKQPFFSAIRWNWPRAWFAYLLGGMGLALVLQLVAQILPMPKELPIDQFFRTPLDAWALSVFGITMAPLLEELFFRGFLYPVLARRLGLSAAVMLTAAGFGLIHSPQLAHAWGPVLIVFIVGLVLTFVRAVSKSVAAGLLIHIAYNGTISVMLFLASDGFRHLDRLNQ
jgi:uncharacterized protein